MLARFQVVRSCGFSIRRFDTSWGEELDDFLKDDEPLERETRFVVDRRNRIAHGPSEGISARKAIDLYQNAQEITDWLIPPNRSRGRGRGRPQRIRERATRSR